MPLGQYTSAFDHDQTFYFKAMGGAGGAREWSRRMRASLARIAGSTPHFHYYIAPGNDHCALPYDRFYATKVEGRRLSDWVRDEVNGAPIESVSRAKCGAPAGR